jgi:uncharacterized protein (DUF983 family)
MPWCEPCGRFFNPNTIEKDGSCPACGNELAKPRATPKVPWHFWLLVVGIAVYLGWRVVQGVMWVTGHI